MFQQHSDGLQRDAAQSASNHPTESVLAICHVEEATALPMNAMCNVSPFHVDLSVHHKYGSYSEDSCICYHTW